MKIITIYKEKVCNSVSFDIVCIWEERNKMSLCETH